MDQVGIMVSDVSRVLVVLLIILVAFASALSIVGSKQDAFSSFGKSLESLSRFMLNLDPPNFDFNQASMCSPTPTLGRVSQQLDLSGPFSHQLKTYLHVEPAHSTRALRYVEEFV